MIYVTYSEEKSIAERFRLFPLQLLPLLFLNHDGRRASSVPKYNCLIDSLKKPNYSLLMLLMVGSSSALTSLLCCKHQHQYQHKVPVFHYKHQLEHQQQCHQHQLWHQTDCLSYLPWPQTPYLCTSRILPSYKSYWQAALNGIWWRINLSIVSTFSCNLCKLAASALFWDNGDRSMTNGTSSQVTYAFCLPGHFILTRHRICY